MATERFEYTGAFKFRAFWQAVYPGAMLAIMAWMATIDVFEFKWWAPLAALGLAAWMVFELVKAFRAMRFAVSLTDEGIEVDGQSARWSEIERAELRRLGIGSTPVIRLHTAAGAVLSIPAATSSLPYIAGVVRGRVTSVSELA